MRREIGIKRGLSPIVHYCSFFLLSIVITTTVHAEVYKCVKQGKTTYSDNRCEDSKNITPLSSKALTNSSSTLKEGLRAFDSGNYELAFNKLNPLVESGDAMAQNTVGKMYLQGLGIAENPDKALILFRNAAKQGLPNAKNNLGVMYAGGLAVPQDYKQAIVWFKEAAGQGYTLAMDNLADMYEYGRGVKPNRQEADMWRKKSQNIRHVESNKANNTVAIRTVGTEEYEKGMQYYYQWKFAEAAPWLQKSAEKGHPEAQLILASLYEKGQGVNKSKVQATYWTEKAKNGAHDMNDNRGRVIINTDPSMIPVETAPIQELRK